MRGSQNLERPLPTDDESDIVSEFIDGVSRAAKESISEFSIAQVAQENRVHSEAFNLRKVPTADFTPRWKSEATMSITFVALQSWEGVVERVEGEDIFVRLFDMSTRSNPEITTSFSTGELDSEDLALAIPGAVFYWKIGYSQSASGKRRDSVIRFRRLPAWSKSTRERAREEGQRLCDLFGMADG